ncbi:MAG: hypothetical protein COT74_02840 [Bdellovibrionales bacterium CG10_big_fil_rev_8_21_14_0_10_45_34]|nr:MAG: hypothetical protein COT74_02840 [Bdellovibrionales bacterium CG10_big_fil_rev_8_21_14_0_10_45_34]
MFLENLKGQLNSEELKQVELKILKGAVDRAKLLSLVFALSFFVYGFTSLEFIKQFDSNATLLNNVLPRFVTNTLPFLLLAYWFRNHESRVRFKVIAWIILLPLIFSAAAMVNVWPTMFNGKSEIFLYVHAANAQIIAMSLLITAAPLKYLLGQIVAICVLFLAPIAWLLGRHNQNVLLDMFSGDMAIFIICTAYATNLTYRLRHKLACMDVMMKKKAAPFLGATLTSAIYDQKDELLRDRMVPAVVVMIDIRSYTEFVKSNDETLVQSFMEAYHTLVQRTVGEHKGCCHKSNGDGHMISFGAMDLDVDLSDIPGIEGEAEAASFNRAKTYTQRALESITKLAFSFEDLKEQFDILDSISLGVGIAFGEVKVGVLGDDEFKKELDINGRCIIRAARLEAYSKIIRNELAPDRSVAVLGPELEPFIDSELRMFQHWQTTLPQKKVPNFHELEHVLYHVFRNSSERRKHIVKLRAS